jgi:hypothetical protein
MRVAHHFAPLRGLQLYPRSGPSRSYGPSHPAIAFAQSPILASRVLQLLQWSSTLRLLASRVACLLSVTLDQQFAASSRTSPPVAPALCQPATHPAIALPPRTRFGPAAAERAGSFDSGKNVGNTTLFICVEFQHFLECKGNE